MRIDPGSQQGTVAVEIVLDGELPRGARADMSVDGTIEIERLPNVMYVGRPTRPGPRHREVSA
jgi:HlyD family secretion protein